MRYLDMGKHIMTTLLSYIVLYYGNSITIIETYYLPRPSIQFLTEWGHSTTKKERGTSITSLFVSKILIK